MPLAVDIDQRWIHFRPMIDEPPPSPARRCFRCKTEKTLDATNFFRSKNRRCGGFSYECKPCGNARRVRFARTKQDRSSPEKKAAHLEYCRRYAKTDMGRAFFLRKSYRKIDACDLSRIEVYDIIMQPCSYCGTTEIGRGLDRIDNSKPHIKGNVLPACEVCNKARSYFFTVEEMKRIGAVIAEIRAERAAKGAERVGRPETSATWLPSPQRRPIP